MCSCHSLFSAQAWPYDWARVGANQTENGVTRIEKAGSERELLSLFLTRLPKLDPDIILGGWGGGVMAVLWIRIRLVSVFRSFVDPDSQMWI